MRTAADPLALLRQSRLLDEAQIARLADSWDGRFSGLLAAGLLTRYQARQLRRGRLDRLRFGPYLLLDRLGSGGDGVVFKAHHTLLDRVVALKVLRRRSREAAVAAGLSHPNIVAAYDAAEHRGRIVVALEYVEGVDLQRLLDEAGPLPVDLAREVVRQTCLALEYLRQRGLVHRDVKPNNLVLVPDAGAPQVKLIDLGLTCGPGDDELCGTPDYLAPERGHGDPADVRGDLYSLGCTFYHLLTGSVPYPGGDSNGKMLRHRLEEPRPIGQFRTDVPPHLVALIGRMMERDPERRIADPDEVIERLEPPPEPVATPRPVRPWRWLLAALLGVTLGVAARAVARPTAAAPATPDRSFLSVEGMSGEFATAAAAAAAAPDGGVIVLHGPGPFRTAPLTLTRPVTIRSAHRAALERDDDEAWEPLITATADLTLDGVTLSDAGLPPLLSLRRSPRLTLRGCSLRASRQAINVEAPDAGRCVVALDRCDVRVSAADGAALLLWRGEPGPSAAVDVSLTGCRVEAGRIVACRALDGPVAVTESSSELTARRARASFDGYRGPTAAVLRWPAK
ncbi:MAG: protein kinase domain-containing protein [Gemmataceae bacterium]